MNQERHANAEVAKLRTALDQLEGIGRLREAAADTQAYLVGGAVRDILLGRPRSDIDVCVVGEADALLGALEAEPLAGGRFGTAVAYVDGLRIDLAQARRERYAQPGALPEVEPAGIEEDLRRRDFTINAMAIGLGEDPVFLDPLGGLVDLREGVLRSIHEDSFVDDPTRALRGARYAARYGFRFEEATEAELRRADLSTVSSERVEAELRRCADEQCAHGALRRCGELGLVRLAPDSEGLLSNVCEEFEREPWSRLVTDGEIDCAAVVLSAAGLVDQPDELMARSIRIAGQEIARPSDALPVAESASPSELFLAAALGASWVASWLDAWRHVRLEIDGEDLIASGVPRGPDVGRGLHAALAAKLDGEARGRAEELDVARRAIAQGPEGRH